MIAAGGDKALNVNVVLGPSPCDACPNRHKCAAYRLACDAFGKFVVAGEGWDRYPRRPNWQTYRRLFG